MRKLLIMTLTVASMLSLSGTATAATTAPPVKHPKLIANPLYEAGALPATTCEEPARKRNDRKSGRAYIDAVIACLESTWEQHLTAAGLPFSKIKVRHVSKLPTMYCGTRETGKENSAARYCGDTGELIFKAGKDWLDDPSDLWLFNTVSYMYGWHVMKLVGIADAYDAVPSSGTAETRELGRRESLQNDCFSTAFLKSVWPLKGRTTKDWTYLLSMVDGDAPGEARWYGKRANAIAWHKRGFATGDPGSCNTWTAPSSKVA
ncbi:hypothetical protein AB0F17_30665 [Nonomuraea sp. NPDC026600]|uniref:hypothetical protein n=1 Tax=Nonomuraea sp. NPDC026600 TaxID=3155363 RepID=UPI0033F0F6A2